MKQTDKQKRSERNIKVLYGGGAGKRTALLRLVKGLEEALLTLPNLIKINYKMSQDRGSPFDPNLRRL